MSFIAKQGAGGFISGNAFVKSSMGGRLAFMSASSGPFKPPFVSDSDKSRIAIPANGAITATTTACGWTYSLSGAAYIAPLSMSIGINPDQLNMDIAETVLCSDNLKISYDATGCDLAIGGNPVDSLAGLPVQNQVNSPKPNIVIPATANVVVGGTLTITATTATDYDSLQWMHQEMPFDGQTTETLTWPNAVSSWDGKPVYLVGYNACGQTISGNCVVTIVDPIIAPVFLAATYDENPELPDVVTYELMQEVIGAGGETCTHSGVWSPDKDGVMTFFDENEPVWAGSRVLPSLGPERVPNGTFDGTDGEQVDAMWSGVPVFDNNRMKVEDIISTTGDIAVTQGNSYRITVRKEAGTTTGTIRCGDAGNAGRYINTTADGLQDLEVVAFDSNIRFQLFAGAGLNAFYDDVSVQEVGEGSDYFADDGSGSLLDPHPYLNVTDAFDDETGLTPAADIAYTWSASNHSDAGDSYEWDFKLSGENQSLLSMGGVPVLEVVGSNIILSDGTNQCSVPVVSTEPHIKASYGAGGMTLDVDGVTNTSPYDGSLGAGVLSTKSTSRRLLRAGS